jgi:hypothetical protein
MWCGDYDSVLTRVELTDQCWLRCAEACRLSHAAKPCWLRHCMHSKPTANPKHYCFYKMLHWINWIVLLSLEPLAGV